MLYCIGLRAGWRRGDGLEFLLLFAAFTTDANWMHKVLLHRIAARWNSTIDPVVGCVGLHLSYPIISRACGARTYANDNIVGCIQSVWPLPATIGGS